MDSARKFFNDFYSPKQCVTEEGREQIRNQKRIKFKTIFLFFLKRWKKDRVCVKIDRGWGDKRRNGWFEEDFFKKCSLDFTFVQ
jgi:hypothetical protein